MITINCPFCGPRDEREFEYCGPHRQKRPDNINEMITSAFIDYLTVPENPEGEAKEVWWHRRGCGAWLLVVRNTRTHEIIEVSELDAT